MSCDATSATANYVYRGIKRRSAEEWYYARLTGASTSRSDISCLRFAM
jgi:hypothetical protein